MTEKVYITSTKMATFVCPKCQKSKTTNVSKFADLDKIVNWLDEFDPDWKKTQDIKKTKK